MFVGYPMQFEKFAGLKWCDFVQLGRNFANVTPKISEALGLFYKDFLEPQQKLPLF